MLSRPLLVLLLALSFAAGGVLHGFAAAAMHVNAQALAVSTEQAADASGDISTSEAGCDHARSGANGGAEAFCSAACPAPACVATFNPTPQRFADVDAIQAPSLAPHGLASSPDPYPPK